MTEGKYKTHTQTHVLFPFVRSFISYTHCCCVLLSQSSLRDNYHQGNFPFRIFLERMRMRVVILKKIVPQNNIT